MTDFLVSPTYDIQMVAIIDYNAGNVHSVIHALRRLGVDPILTDDKNILSAADKILFPGVGEAATTMEYLRKKKLDQFIKEIKQPLLGICLGMQLMCRYSEEGDAECLGIFDASVLKFIPARQEDKIPHMGWNTLSGLRSGLYKGLEEGDFVYFVHSYYVPLEEHTIAQTNHILDFSASLHKDNFYAVQFHPEKSGVVGEKILDNFLSI